MGCAHPPLLTGCVIALITSIAAQAPGAHPQHYSTRRWTNANGLPQVQVNALAQDHDGFLWIGTYGGLVRFDGVDFTVFDQARRDAPCPNRIQALWCDRDGDLWIGSEGGGLLRREGDRFVQHLPGNVMDIAQAGDGSLVVAESDALWRSTPDRTSFTKDPTLSMVRLTHMRLSPDGRVFLLLNERTLVSRAGGWEQLLCADGSPVTATDADFEDDGTAWIRCDGRIGRCASGTKVVEILGDKEGHGALLRRDRKGLTWFDRSGTLYHAATPEAPTPTAAAAIGDQRERSLLFDRDGNLWLGDDNGLLLVTPTPLEILDNGMLGASGVGPVLADPRGGVWFGGAQGLYHLADGRVEQTTLRGQHVRAIANDPAGGLWLCASSQLLHHDGERTLDAALPQDPQLGDSMLRALWVDPDGTVWAGGLNGLYRLRDGRFTTWRRADGLPSADVLTIVRDGEGALWIGTAAGVCRLRGDRVETVLTGDGRLPLPVRAIAPAPDGAVWFGTYGAGLCRWHADDVRWFTTQDGLPDNSISAVVLLPNDRIAVTTNRGLAEADLALVAATGAPQRCALRWTTMNTSAGHTMVEAQGGHQPAACLASDGSLWFAVVGGLAYRPAGAELQEAQSRPHIEGLRTSDGSAVAPGAALPPDVRDFTITYTAPSFVAPELLRFRYRLLPLDAGWVDAGTARTATFRRLPPGEYSFEVTTAGAGAPTVATVRIDIPPHWYERDAVRIVGLVLGMLTLLGAGRFRAAALRHRAKRLADLVQQRTGELAAEVEVRRRTERELVQHRDELDARVHARTAELSQAYDQLAHETAERERLQADLRQTQKMDSLGLLAGGIAHDFNNLLTVINSSAELGADDELPASARTAFADILKAGTTAAHLTRQLLIFARRHSVEPAAQRVGSCVAAARMLLERSVGDEVRLVLDLDDAPWAVSMPNGHLEQILVNTCINARDAMPGGGTVTIATRKVTLAAADAPPGLGGGEFVELCIADCGTGMDATTRERALDPFFTTKRDGTGLGLSTCYGIAGQAGGTLTLQSEPGEGTTVRVLLPRHQAPTTTSAPAPERAGESLAVLVVDDRQDVRDTVRRMLTHLGHRVTVAATGAEALAMVTDPEHAFDLLIVDVMMPQMPGPAIAAQVASVRPELAVVFMSGSVSFEAKAQIEGIGAPFLPKPFTSQELQASMLAAFSARSRTRRTRSAQ